VLETRRLAGAFRSTHPGTLAANFWRCRYLLWYLILRNLRVQYKQSIFGYAWVLLSPLFQLLVYSFVFSQVLNTPSQGGVPFLLFLLVGLIPWIFFSNSIAAATESISGAGALVSVVYFPREILTAAAVLTRVIDLAAGLFLFVVAMLIAGEPLRWSAVWMLPLLVVQVLFTLGLALPLAALNVFFRDVRFLVAVGLNLWFFVTPILYPVDVVPERYQFVYDLNPMSRLVSSYRWAMFAGVAPPIESILWSIAVSLAVLYVGYRLFKSMEPVFADNV